MTCSLVAILPSKLYDRSSASHTSRMSGGTNATGRARIPSFFFFCSSERADGGRRGARTASRGSKLRVFRHLQIGTISRRSPVGMAPRSAGKVVMAIPRSGRQSSRSVSGIATRTIVGSRTKKMPHGARTAHSRPSISQRPTPTLFIYLFISIYFFWGGARDLLYRRA